MKLIIAIFEGADFDILNSFIKKSYLPNFKKLKNIHRSKCTCIPYEAAGLMSAFSGIPEKEHGISSYWKSQNYSYIPELWNSNEIKDAMIWNQSYMRNIKTAIVNLWGTHPVYPMNGCIISYSMEKSLKYFYPTKIRKELLEHNINCVQDTCILFNKNLSKKDFCSSVRKIDLLRHKTVSHFIKDNDLIIINYTAIDRISHFFFDEYLNNSLSSELYSAYKQCDDILGELFITADQQNSDLIVFSEIGFGKLKKFVNINDELSKAGLLKYELDGKIDWEHTIAFESVQGSHGININKENVFKNGTVNSNEYKETQNTTIDFLKSIVSSETGYPLFKNVIKSSEYYNSIKNVPDIILEPFNEEYLPYGDPYWSNFLTRKAQTGWHRSNGIFSSFSKKNVPNHDIYVHELFEIIKQHL